MHPYSNTKAMKKAMFLFFFFISGLFVFQSCKRCASCNQTVTKEYRPTYSYMNREYEKVFKACGDELKSAKGQNYTVTTYAYQTDHIDTVVQTTKTICFWSRNKYSGFCWKIMS